MKIRLRILCNVLLLTIGLVSASIRDGDDNETFMVVRAHPNTTEQLDFVRELHDNMHTYDLDFWLTPHLVGQMADMMVRESRLSWLKDRLGEMGISHFVSIPDVQKLIIDREQKSKSSKISQLIEGFRKRYHDEGGNRAKYGFGDYHSYDTIVEWMNEIERQYPDRAKVITIGQTDEQRPIKTIKLGTNIHNTARKVIWMDGGIHAREWAAVHTTVYFIDRLIADYDTDPIVREAMDNLHFYVTPVLNPDGYEFSRTGVSPMIRLWRKNRSNMVCKKDRWFRDRCCGGVDLNRNFDWFWGEIGSSSDKCSEIYQGSAVWSEAESRAVRDMVFSPELRGKIEAFITLHTYSQMWIHPFSHQRKTVPEDIAETEEVGRRAVAALEGMYGTKYRFGTGADILYPSAGGSDDWAKGKGGAKFVYLLELRPGEEVWDGFILDSRQLMPTAKETWAGVKVVIDAVNQRNRRAAPPVVATSSIFDKFIALKSFLVDVVKTLFTDKKKEESTTTTTMTTSVEPPTTEAPTTLRSKSSFEHFTRRLVDLATIESTTLGTTSEDVTAIEETSTTTSVVLEASTFRTTVPTTEPPLTLMFLGKDHRIPVTDSATTESTLSSVTSNQSEHSTTTTTSAVISTVSTTLPPPARIFLSQPGNSLSSTIFSSNNSNTFADQEHSAHTSTPTTASVEAKTSNSQHEEQREVGSTSSSAAPSSRNPSTKSETHEHVTMNPTVVDIAITNSPEEFLPFSIDPKIFDVSSTVSSSMKPERSSSAHAVESTLMPTISTTVQTPTSPSVADTTFSTMSTTTSVESTLMKTTTTVTTVTPQSSTEGLYSTPPLLLEVKANGTTRMIVWTVSEPQEATTEETSTLATEITADSISSMITTGLVMPASSSSVGKVTTSPPLKEDAIQTPVAATSSLVKPEVQMETLIEPTVTEAISVPATVERKKEDATIEDVEAKVTNLSFTATVVGNATQAIAFTTISGDMVINVTSRPDAIKNPGTPEEHTSTTIPLTLLHNDTSKLLQNTTTFSDPALPDNATLPESLKSMDEAIAIEQKVMEQLEMGLAEDTEQVEVSAADEKETKDQEENDDSGEYEDTVDDTAVTATTLLPLPNATNTVSEFATANSTASVQTTSTAPHTGAPTIATEVTTSVSSSTTTQIVEVLSSSTTPLPKSSTVEVISNQHHLKIDELEEEVLPPVIVAGTLAATGVLAVKATHTSIVNRNGAAVLHPPLVAHHRVLEKTTSALRTGGGSNSSHHAKVQTHAKGSHNPPGIKPLATISIPPIRSTSSNVVTQHPRNPITPKVLPKTSPSAVVDQLPQTAKQPVDPTLVALETHLELSVPPPPPTDQQIQVNASRQDHEATTITSTTKHRPSTRRKSNRHHHKRTKKPRTNTKSHVSNHGHTTTARPGNVVAARKQFRTRHFIAPTTVATTTTTTAATTTTESVTEAARLEIVRPRLGSRRNRTRPVLMGREETRVLLAERFRQQQARLDERRQEARRRGQSGSAVRVVSGNVENRTPSAEPIRQPAPAFQQQPQQPQTLCIDRSPWCGAWIHGNPAICQISSIYMRRDCARSCRYCS